MKTLEQLLDEEMAAYYEGEYMDHSVVKHRLRELLQTARAACRAEALEEAAQVAMDKSKDWNSSADAGLSDAAAVRHGAIAASLIAAAIREMK